MVDDEMDPELDKKCRAQVIEQIEEEYEIRIFDRHKEELLTFYRWRLLQVIDEIEKAWGIIISNSLKNKLLFFKESGYLW